MTMCVFIGTERAARWFCGCDYSQCSLK